MGALRQPYWQARERQAILAALLLCSWWWGASAAAAEVASTASPQEASALAAGSVSGTKPAPGASTDADLLLRFKASFSNGGHGQVLGSWKSGTDPCTWKGIGCSEGPHHVTTM